MTRTILTHAFTLAWVIGSVSTTCRAADTAAPSPGQRAVQAAAEQDQFAFLLFYRTNDAATRGMHQVVQTTLSERQDATIVAVRIGDPAERVLVERFDAGRLPMPAVVALAPNGAVTGVFQQRVMSQHLTAAIVSAGQAQCLKALQETKIVLLCVQPEGDNVIPPGVRQFRADELYRDRTEVVNVRADDPAESRFLRQLRLRTDQPSPAVAFMAPPGVMLGTFDANVTHATLAQTLAAAGQCCDDANCRHHRAADGNRPARR